MNERALVFGGLILAMGMTLSMQVLAQDRTAADLQACRSIEDKARRLACFDAISEPSARSPTTVMPVAPGTRVQAPAAASVSSPTAPASAVSSTTTPAAPATVTAVPRDGSFGSEQVVVPIKPDAPKALTAHTTNSFDGIRRGQRITLDNGQVWLNIDDRGYDYEANAPEAVIERNFMGNYWMKLADASFRFRVRRVK